MRIGVLGIQGDIREHVMMLNNLGVDVVVVKTPKDLEDLDGLVIPGGESTTIWNLMEKKDLIEPLRRKIEKGLAVYGTCAGMIVLSKGIENYPNQKTLGVIDITVRRNAYGRQVDSFEVDLDIPVLGERSFRAVFIRAPMIVRVGKDVEVLARHGETPVMVKQGKILASSFHPELTEDTRIHEYFLKIVESGERI
ncbi:MAG: pyridoxal 5'-phosphate synthase glutaminase subunit PdxT [Thermotogae bacterium]|nr:pyridoxal 5'-phosphate synthase glutaminase subunit PdxT [Thermotogota bacterium]